MEDKKIKNDTELIKEAVAPLRVPEITDHNQALLVLVNAARIGQMKGIYSLEEAEFISKAIRMFAVTGTTEPNTPTSTM